MTPKLPAFQFYPGDWRKDPGVQSLSFQDRGIWWEMLLLMHESERRGYLLLNGRPMTEESLSRALGLDKQILTTTLTVLLETGVASRDKDSGAIFCRRMIRDENLRKVRSEAGKLGGNPVLVKQNPTTQVNHSLKMKNEDEVADSVDVRCLSESVGIFGMREQADMARLLATFVKDSSRPVQDAITWMTHRWVQYQRESAGHDWQYGSSYKFFMSGKWDTPATWANGKPASSPPNPGSRPANDSETHARETWESMSEKYKKENPWVEA